MYTVISCVRVANGILIVSINTVNNSSTVAFWRLRYDTNRSVLTLALAIDYKTFLTA